MEGCTGMVSAERRRPEMNARAIGVVVVALIIGLATACFAGKTAGRVGDTFTQNAQYKIALHLEAQAVRTCTKGMPVLSTRGDLVHTWAGYANLDVFLVVFQYDEVTAVQFGLAWPGAWGSAATTHCGEFNVGNIVNPGDGMAVSWSICQTPSSQGGTRPDFWPVAWSWILPASDAEIALEENPATGKIGITDCAYLEYDPDSVFFAGINTVPYEGPFVATQPTTWGDIKAMFR
jgi:hypothetical protein